MGQKKHKYKIELTPQERGELIGLTMRGSTKVRKFKRAKILLLADENHSQGGLTDKEIAQKLDTSPATVVRIRRNYVEEGLEGALNEKPRSGKPPTITGEERAKITAIACSEPMEGYSGWSLRLIAARAVELGIVDTISHNAVGEILKKTN